jgi:hypothetical protein
VTGNPCGSEDPYDGIGYFVFIFYRGSMEEGDQANGKNESNEEVHEDSL